MWDFLKRLRAPQELEQETAERHRVESELRRMQAELELRIAERTADLTRANAALQAEIAVRKRAEEELARAREWFEVTLASVGDAVIVTDTQGRVTFLNQVARDLTGWRNDVQDVSLDALYRTIHAGTGDPAENPVDRVLTTGAIQGFANHTVLIAADGSQRAIDYCAAPIRNDRGEVLAVVLVFRDVTEQRRVAEALREADHRKDQFLAMLGHELRNPLSGIAGAIQVLSLVGSQDAESSAMRQIIERQTAHMSRMINDVLEVSRISRGMIQIRPETLDLVELVRNTTEDLRRTLRDGKLSLHLALPDHPVYVAGDPTRLAQVLVNLLQNAAKFTNAGGEVAVTLGCNHDQKLATVSVRDTGIGMSPETLSHAFEPFSQADSSLERSRGGLGLGLALVKGLVELHGGQVSTTSSGLGQGAEFTIHLPLAPAQPDMPKEVRRDETTSQSLRILIIDDQRDASYPLRKLLEFDGHRVEVAADGPTGVEAARRFRPQIVLCDIGLPGGMNGYAVAHALRGNPRTSAATLVAVTGYGQEEDRRQSAAAGFDRHLTKPVGQCELRSLLSDVPIHRPG